MKRMAILFNLIALIQITMSSCHQKAEPVTYLIPEEYKGRVEVIFNQNGKPVKYKNIYNRDTVYTSQLGSPIKYENGRRIYEIPPNGILLTQFKDNYGVIDEEYYYTDEKGNRKKLKVVPNHEAQEGVINDKNEVAVFYRINGAYGSADVPFQGFLLCTFNDLKVFGKEYHNGFQKQLKEVLKYDF